MNTNTHKCCIWNAMQIWMKKKNKCNANMNTNTHKCNANMNTNTHSENMDENIQQMQYIYEYKYSKCNIWYQQIWNTDTTQTWHIYKLYKFPSKTFLH